MSGSGIQTRPARRYQLRSVTPLELEVLRALSTPARRWKTSARLADELDLYPFRIRGCLQALKRAALVECARSRGTYGWAITPAGRDELAERASGAGLGLPHDRTAERCRGESSRPTPTTQENAR